MIRTDKRLRLCTALLVWNLAFIWGNSLMPAEISQAFSDWVKALLVGLFSPGESIAEGSGLLRKLAHFAEFTALGTLLTWRCGMLGRTKRLAFFTGAAAACVDETIQMFVPGRGPGIRDVLLDSSGVLTGVILLSVSHKLLKKKTNQFHSEE